MAAYSRRQRLAAEGLGTALLLATVVGSGIMADALTDEAGEAYFEARVTVDPAAVADLPGIALLPGMPVEVTLTIGERRAGAYFVEPLLRRFGRALREE